MKSYSGILVDLFSRRLFRGEIRVENGKIVSVKAKPNSENRYILPGLIDSHVHIESSMTVPSVFAEMAVACGTVAVVCDPHEIANVMGEEGIDYMLKEAEKVPLKFYFGVPSCVPATPFESSGAVLDSRAVESLLARKELHYLSEMMNFPGVIKGVSEVLAKLDAARKFDKPVDGHAPGLQGVALEKYIGAGIFTDHEAYSYEEALEKIKLGMKIQIREGSAAQNFEALYPLIEEFPESIMLCTDDAHPDTLLYEGQIDKLLRLGRKKGLDLFKLLRAAVLNPIEHYGLEVGLLREGDPADFIMVEDLESFRVLSTFIEGKCVYESEKVLFNPGKSPVKNVFCREKIGVSELKLKLKIGEGLDLLEKPGKIRVILAHDGELVTGQEFLSPKVEKGELVSDPVRDLLKLVVLSRYDNSPAQVAFVKNFGLKKGAIASSIAHDSHNLIAVGVKDEDLVSVINKLVENKGGIVVGADNEFLDLPLEVAGLMSTRSGKEVVARYRQLLAEAKKLGTSLKSPFMTLSFMSLLVIPELKLGDKGLFDVGKFEFVKLWEAE